MIRQADINEQPISNTKHNQINVFVDIMISIIFLIISYFDSDINDLTIVSLVIFGFGVRVISKKNKSIINIVNVFYTLCFIFHCSYYLLIITNNIRGNAYVFLTLPKQVQVNTLKFCNCFFSLFPLGTMLSNGIKQDKKNHVFLSANQCSTIGITLMTIALFPRLYVDITTFNAYLQGGYIGVYRVYINNYIMLLANMFYLGSVLSIYGYKKNKSKATMVLVFTMILIFISMMSGRRGTKVAYLVIILYMYFKCVDRKKTNILLTLRNVFIGYTILVIIATFGDTRETGTFTLSNFLSLFVKNFTYELIFDQFGEFGYAAYTLGATIEYIPTQKYGYGLNYIFSWLEILPNVGGYLTGFSDKMSFVLKLPSQYQQALGGSMLGELFYNFGYFSAVLAILLGYIINNISFRIDHAIKKDGISSVDLICILTAIPMMLWVRSVFNEFPRSIIWFYLIIYIFKSFFYKGNKDS